LIVLISGYVWGEINTKKKGDNFTLGSPYALVPLFFNYNGRNKTEYVGSI
jgi:hypothetical protein